MTCSSSLNVRPTGTTCTTCANDGAECCVAKTCGGEQVTCSSSLNVRPTDTTCTTCVNEGAECCVAKTCGGEQVTCSSSQNAQPTGTTCTTCVNDSAECCGAKTCSINFVSETQCASGSVVRSGGQSCSSCDASECCREKQCTCAHGTGMTGVDCPDEANAACVPSSCNEGYYYEPQSNDCVKNPACSSFSCPTNTNVGSQMRQTIIDRSL